MINSNFNYLQFGQLRLAESSIRKAVYQDSSDKDSIYPAKNGVDQVKEYRRMRNRFKPSIDLLDRAGLDIEIRGHLSGSDTGLEYDLDMPVIEARLIDKDKNPRYSVLEKTQASALDVISKIVAEGINKIMVADDADVSLKPPKRNEDPTRTWTSRDLTIAGLERLLNQIKTNHAIDYNGQEEN